MFDASAVGAGGATGQVGFVVPLVKWACFCCCRSRHSATNKVGLVGKGVGKVDATCEGAAVGTGWQHWEPADAIRHLWWCAFALEPGNRWSQ